MKTITITDQECDLLKSLIARIEDVAEPVKPTDLLKGLHQGTKDFLKSLYNEYGISEIHVTDKKFQNLVHEHYIKDIDKSFCEINKRGGVSIKYRETGKTRRIHSVKLLMSL